MTTGATLRACFCLYNLPHVRSSAPGNLARDGIAAVFGAGAAEQAVRAAHLPGARRADKCAAKSSCA